MSFSGEVHRQKYTLKHPHPRPWTAVLTSEAHAAGADVAAGHVLTRASVHAGVGFTLVVVDVTVLAAPARVTQAFVTDREQHDK